MSAELHPMFARLFRDMAANGLFPSDEQMAGTTVPEPSRTGDAAGAFARAREATPLPYLPGHAGKEL
ncbi:hypothetical protein [Lysobacter sp. Root96]|uniref:hypothetical protein n=1 Tax=Lysobacter sp. Root96 TaxID=1736612 RepID=UPI000B2E1645|nr:hypothetical protein [Lysobacter sp. Root96]